MRRNTIFGSPYHEYQSVRDQSELAKKHTIKCPRNEDVSGYHGIQIRSIDILHILSSILGGEQTIVVRVLIDGISWHSASLYYFILFSPKSFADVVVSMES